MKTYIFLWLLIVQCVSSFVFAQNRIAFQNLSDKGVEVQSIVYAIKQDSIGNVWMATEEGVLKYNSKTLKTYNVYKGFPENLGNRVTSLLVDSKQNVWAGLEKGICLYDESLDTFKQVVSGSSVEPILINAIEEDEEGNIWIGAFNGLWRCKRVKGNYLLELIVGNYNIQAICNNGNDLVFGALKGLFVYNHATDDLRVIDIADDVKISSIKKYQNRYVLGGSKGGVFEASIDLKTINKRIVSQKISSKIKDFEITANGNLYVATDGDGIYEVNENFLMVNHFTENPDSSKSISSNGVYDLELGKEDILWIATYGGGVNYYDANYLPFQKIQHQTNNSNSIAVNFTRSVAVDANKNIWFGTKKGLSIWNVKNNTWKHISTFKNNKEGVSDIVLALTPDDSFMWVGTFNHGFFKVNINTFKSQLLDGMFEVKLQKVYAIFKDSNKNIWIGGIKEDVVVVRPNGTVDTYPITQIKSFTQIKSGAVLAVGRNGVFQINDTTKEFHLIEKLKPNKNTLAFTTINAVYQNQDDQIVLATNGAGIVFYNLKTDKVQSLTLKNGLPSEIVQGVLSDKSGDLWASTTKGLVQVKIEQNDTLINVFDKKDGLVSTEFNYGSYAELNDSLLAFGGIDGVVVFNPEKIKTKHYKPILVFEKFRLFNKEVLPGDGILRKQINETDKIELKNSENSIEIKFSGILYGATSQTKYTWKLDGFDEKWSAPSVTNFATYTNLNSGDYVFRVKAVNKYNQFSKERQLKIKIKSSWWLTLPAFLIYGLLILGAIYLIIHFTSVAVKKRNADEQIDFFNNVTHEIKTPLAILISSLDGITENSESPITGDSKMRIKTTVKRINSLFEQMLNFHKLTAQNHVSQDVSKLELNTHLHQIVADFYPLTKERDLNIEVNHKWTDRFFYHDKAVFNKILFNLISNAIKYSFDKGKITVTTGTTMQGELKIEVIDEGLGIPKDQQKHILKRYYRARNVINSQRSGTGLGLVMIKKLLEKTGGSISFKSTENKGTVFTVLLKNQIKAYKKQEVDIETAIHEIEGDLEDLQLEEFSDNKILIVEDNDELREVLSNTLATYFQVYEAKNGKEGLQMASQFFPDLILTDLIMPEMDGMQMARQLKDDINLNHIPVFMLTVLQNSTQKLESIEAGIAEYIEKPVDMKMLLAKMTNILKWQKKLHKKYMHENDAEKATLFRNKNDQDFLQNLEDRIIENIVNNSFSVHDLSESFGMSRTSLYMKLKNLVDLSPQDFIIHTKLKHAKNLLIKGGLSIKEVAYNSGFSNPKYFSTSFKKFYSMTPTGFLDSLKEK